MPFYIYLNVISLLFQKAKANKLLRKAISETSSNQLVDYLFAHLYAN